MRSARPPVHTLPTHICWRHIYIDMTVRGARKLTRETCEHFTSLWLYFQNVLLFMARVD